MYERRWVGGLLCIVLVWVSMSMCWKYEYERSLVHYDCFVRPQVPPTSFLKLPYGLHSKIFDSPTAAVLSDSWNILNAYSSAAFSAIRQKTCTPRSDPFQALNKNLSLLVGQSSAQNLIQSILHQKSISFDPSPTLLHFYGPPATGKTLTAQIIAESFFQFQSYSEKPLPLLVLEPEHFSALDSATAKSNLTSLLFEHLLHCPKSIVLFDDFHKFDRPILLEVVQQFSESKIITLDSKKISTSQMLFIFTSPNKEEELIKKLKKDVHKIEFKSFEDTFSIQKAIENKLEEYVQSYGRRENVQMICYDKEKVLPVLEAQIEKMKERSIVNSMAVDQTMSGVLNGMLKKLGTSKGLGGGREKKERNVVVYIKKGKGVEGENEFDFQIEVNESR